MLKWLLLLFIIQHLRSFTFLYPSVSPNVLTINTITTYTFFAERSYDINLSPTPYSAQLVAAGSPIIIQFPSQYTLSSPNVSSLLINDASIPSFTFNVSSNNITIANGIGNNSAIANVTITVDNILNPYPAITTSPFIIAIGTDVSASSTSSSITLTPGTFVACSVSFSPSTVNTTGAMVVSLTPKNKILGNNSIVITFPPSLQWSQDISTSHSLPIGSTLTCLNVLGAVTSASCSGEASSAIVTYRISAINGSSLISAFSYSISSLFSPPTTSPPDTLDIRSVSSTGDYIDTCTTTISGLTAQSLSVALATSSSPLYINSLTSLIFNFTLADTISKSDYFQLTFPAGTTFSFVAIASSNLNLFSSGVTFNSTNLTLIMRQASTSPTRFAGTVCTITIGRYTAPPSTKTTDPFTFQVYTSTGGLKMQGLATISATANTYIATVGAASSNINKNTSYTFIVTTLDSMLSSSMIQVKFPSELTLSISANCVSSTNFSSAGNMTCTMNGTNTVLIKNLSSSTITPGIYSFTIGSVVNRGKALTTSNFSLTYYYSSDTSGRVGTSNSAGVTLLANPINASSISGQLSNNSVTASGVTMNITFTAEDAVAANGYIMMTIPSEISIITSYVAQCIIYVGNVSNIPSCSLTNATFRVPIGSMSIDAGQAVTVTLIGFAINPKSTRPTSFLSIYTYSSDNFMIGYSNSSFRVSSFVPVGYSFLSLVQSNSTNSLATTYTVKLQQSSSWDSNSSLLIQLPPAVTSNSSIVCADSNTDVSIDCSYSGNSSANFIKLNLATSGNSLQVKISSLTNPISYQPTSAFTFTTFTTDSYIYATDSSNKRITNSLPSAFGSVKYSFNSTTYNTTTNLLLNITNIISSTSGYTLLSFGQFVNTTISNITCNASIDIACAVNNTSLIITPSITGSLFPINTTIQIDGLFIPLANTSQMTLQSSSNSYLVSEFVGISWQTTCTLPCYTCNSSTPTVCLSCYTTTTFTSMIYYFNNSCLNACPVGFIALNGSLTCSACSANCAECSIAANNCTECNQNSTTKLLVIDSRICVSTCESGYYSTNSTASKYTQVCQKCVYPCATCTSATACLSCANTSLYFYKQQCVVSCPVLVSVANTSSMECDPCASNCGTCVNTSDTCLTCNVSVAPLFIAANSTCVSSCPATLVPDNNNTVCVSCQSPCSSCSLIKTNCTGCLASTNTYLSAVVVGACVSTCDQFYFANSTSQTCQSCSSIIDLHCKNCYNSTYCISCDLGYVLYSANHSCLSGVPSGFINISGIAAACTSNCTECSVTVQNCTVCSGNFSLYIWLGKGSCLTTCPNTTISNTNICVNCTSPCLTCSNNTKNCTSCLTGYLYSSNYNNSCQNVCPDRTYTSPTSAVCLSCSLPCANCINSSTQCTTCATAYLYNQSCTTICPSTSTPNNISMACDICTSPCLTCENQTKNCTSCIPTYLYYSVTNRCYTACPENVSIVGAGNNSNICISCTSPCATCSLALTNCTSCVTGMLYFNFSCLSTCADGYYASGGICQPCTNNCTTCVDQSSKCSSCSGAYNLYQSTCTKNCPVAYSIVINNTCASCSNNCLNCTSADYCYECPLGTVLLNGVCSTTCPSALVMFYNTTSNKYVCVTQEYNQEQQQLKASLQFSSILPLPFTIVTTFLFLCCLMSKLQNIQTYVTGIGYSLYGCAESASIAYLLYNYISNYSATGSTYSSLFLLLVVCLGIIVGLNAISLVLITPCLCGDIEFNNWLNSKRRGTPPKQQDASQQLSQDLQTVGSQHKQNESVQCLSHRCTFTVFTLLSFMISFKLRLFIFTKLFRFRCLTAHLQDIHGFRVFNIMSVLGFGYEGVYCYIAYKMFGEYSFQNDYGLMMAVVDCLVVVIISFILALITTQKEEDFFKIKEQNKNKVDLGRRKKAKDPKNYKIDTKRLMGMNSRDKLVDINESHSNLGEQQEEIIVNHNILRSHQPQKVGSAWVERTSPKASNSPRGKAKNIFEAQEQDSAYDPFEHQNQMSARDRVDLFHTSVHPKKNTVANTFWVQKQPVKEGESKLQKSSLKAVQRVEASMNANLSVQQLPYRPQEQINELPKEVGSKLKSTLIDKQMRVSECRAINLQDIQYFQEKGLQNNKIDQNQIVKEVQQQDGSSQRTKQPQPKQLPNQSRNKIDIVNLVQLDNSIEQAHIIESREKSFESVLPFVHEDGVLKDKKPSKIKDKQPSIKLMAKKNNKVDASVSAKSIVMEQRKQMIKQQQNQPLQELLDLSEIVEKNNNKNNKNITKPIDVQPTINKHMEIQHAMNRPKMGLVTQQVKQTFTPKTKIQQGTQPEPIKSKSINLFSAQYQDKIEPERREQSSHDEMPSQQKYKHHLGLKKVAQMNQVIEPSSKQSEASKQQSKVVHAPKVYSRNKLLNNQMPPIEELDQFEVQLKRRQDELQKIKEEQARNNQLLANKHKNAYSVKNKSQKGQTGIIITRPRKQPQEEQQEEIQNIEFDKQSHTPSQRKNELLEKTIKKSDWIEAPQEQNRNIFDKQMYSQSQSEEQQDIERTFKRSQHNGRSESHQLERTSNNVRVYSASQNSQSQHKQQQQQNVSGEDFEQKQEQSVEQKTQRQQQLQQINDNKQQEVNNREEHPEIQHHEHSDSHSHSHSNQQESQQHQPAIQQNQQREVARQQEESQHYHSQNDQQRQEEEYQEQEREPSGHKEQHSSDQQQQDQLQQQLEEQPSISHHSQPQQKQQQQQPQFLHQQQPNQQYQQEPQVSHHSEPTQQQYRSESKQQAVEIPRFIAQTVPHNIQELQSSKHDYTVQKIDRNYEESNHSSSEQQESIQFRKTNKQLKHQPSRYQQKEYKSPFIFDRDNQREPREMAADEEEIVFQRVKQRQADKSKSKAIKVEQKPNKNEEVVKLLKNVNHGRSRKALPKQERDERILIKMNRQSIAPQVQDTNIVRKSTQKKNPLSTFKYEKKNEDYSDQEPTTTNRNPPLNKAITARNLVSKPSSNIIPLDKPASSSFDINYRQPVIVNNIPKVRKPQGQVRQFNFGDEISSQVSNTNYNSEAELVKWKQNFVKNNPTNIQASEDGNNVPDRPLINKLSQFEQQAGDYQQLVEQRRARQRRGKRRSKDKGGKSTSRNKKSQLQRIYGA